MSHSDDDLLFEAFLRGFEQSAEGFNGEWCHERYHGKDGVRAPALLERLRPRFEAWLAEQRRAG